MDPVELLTPEGMLRRLDWQVVRRLDGRLQGDYRTLLRGDGTDFLDLRAYEWGDDVRHIDWNATARMDQLLVRDFMEDRELTAWLVIDRSRSMTFGPAGRTKEHVLCELAAVFGQLLVRNGNRVGAIIFDGERHWVLPPRQGRNHVLVLLHHLLRPVEAAASTDLAKLFRTAERLVRRRSLVVVITDFVSEPGWERPLLRLTRRHEVVAVRMVDPRERELPSAGLLYVQDAESGEVLLVDSSDPEFRRRLHALADDRDDTIRQSVARARIDLHVVSTEDDLLSAFARDGGESAPEAQMTFATPEWLWALLVVPAVVAVYVAARRRRARRSEELAAQGLLVSGAGGRQGWRRNLPFTFFAAALALLAVAVARPMATVETPRLESTVILAMDVSNSMGAKDVEPSRIGAAEQAARDFVGDQPSSVKIGLVAFGPSAVIVRTPTFDHPAVLRTINDLSLGGGTSLATGILTSLDALAGKTLKVNGTALNEDNSNEVNIGYFGGATIVLISDGEDTSQINPVTMARLASSAGVRIQTIGVGTVAGTTVQIGGFSVATALDPQTLEDVAKVANGTYHQVDDRAAVRDVSETIDLHFTVVSEYIQISAIFAVAAMLVLVVGALLSVLWFGRVM